MPGSITNEPLSLVLQLDHFYQLSLQAHRRFWSLSLVSCLNECVFCNLLRFPLIIEPFISGGNTE